MAFLDFNEQMKQPPQGSCSARLPGAASALGSGGSVMGGVLRGLVGVWPGSGRGRVGAWRSSGGLVGV